MARKKTPPSTADLQPQELKETMREFLKRLTNVDNELEDLRQARKELLEEFSDRVDVQMLTKAMQVIKVEAGVSRKSTYDELKVLLLDNFVNDLVDA